MRLIDADKLIEDLVKNRNFYPALVASAIKNTPTADAVEVRHGRWIEHTHKSDWLEDDVEVYYNCSECGTSHWSIIPPYCPNCGAKMDGERKDDD